MIYKDKWYTIAESYAFPANGEINISLGESTILAFCKCDYSSALISLKNYVIAPELIFEIRIQRQENRLFVDFRYLTTIEDTGFEPVISITSGSDWQTVVLEQSIVSKILTTLGDITGVNSESGVSSHVHANKSVLDRIISFFREADIGDITDNSIFSGLRSRKEFLRKNAEDTAAEKIIFKKGIKSNLIESESEFISDGFMGSGFGLNIDANGKAILEVDELLVRQSATFYEIIIQQLKYQGGIVFYTAASMECLSVTEQADSYRCFFDTKDGQLTNEWAIGDQARCQRFAGKYYWRLVVAVGEDYIDLSKADTNGAGIPEAGDVIVQLGNRTDTGRQAAKVTTVIGANSPRDEYYEGISSYNLTGKLITIVGIKDGKAGIYTSYGEFAGKVTVGAGSSGLSELSEWAAAAQDIQDAQSTANQGVQAAASLQSYIDNVLPTELTDLQKQIDKQVESWDFAYVPTLLNYPANEWATDVLKDQHIHDTFYNNQPFVDNTTTPDAGKAWRFTKSGGTYFWNPISDSDAVKALALAAQAQDTADGKRRVFVTQPTTPYEVGDLWTQGTAGDIMRCINARLSGAYVAGDWDKAVKYTDDTAVNNLKIGGRNLYRINQVITAPTGFEITDRSQNGFAFLSYWDSALRYVIKDSFSENGVYTISGYYFQSYPAARSINWYLGTTGITNIYSANTKVKFQFTVTVTDYTTQELNFAPIGGSDNRIIDFKIELGNKATDWTPAYEDIYADATAKSNAAIATAQEYALAKANLAEVTAKAYADGVVTEEETRAIADATAKANAAQAAAIAAAAADATAKSNAIQVGGNNLIEKSNYLNSNYSVQEGVTLVSGNFFFKNAAAFYRNPAIGFSINSTSYVSKLITGESYTLSFYAYKEANANNPRAWIYGGANEINNEFTIPNNVWTRCVYTFVFSGTFGEHSIFAIKSSVTDNNGLYLKQIQIERGNKATDWTPAHEDTTAAIAAAKATADEAAAVTSKFGTTIDGGLVSAAMVKLRDPATADGTETAGMNGGKGNGSNPAFWAGGNYTQALQDLAAIIFRHSGAAKIGELHIEENGVITIKDAVTGQIRLMFNASELPLLSTLLDSAQITGSQYNSGVSLTSTGSSIRPNTLSVTQANSKLSLVGGWSISALAPTTGTALVYAHIYILKDGAFYTSVKSVNLTLNVNNSSEAIIEPSINFSLSSVPVGVYSVAVDLSISEDGSHDTSVNLTLDESTLSFVFEKDIKQVRFGTDGQMLFYAADKYLYLTSKTGVPFIKSRGEWDIPGLRSAVNISSGGIATKMYGISIAAELTSQGLYTITHNIGHSNYTAHPDVINASARINAVVTAKFDNYCTVRIVNVYTDALTNSAFDLTICANG